MVSNGLGLLTYTSVLRMFSLVGFLLASDRLLYTLMTLDSALRHWAREALERTGLFSTLNSSTWASASGKVTTHPASNCQFEVGGVLNLLIMEVSLLVGEANIYPHD